MSNNDKKQGLLVVISGPAGSGKGTVIAELLRDENAYSVAKVAVKLHSEGKTTNDIAHLPTYLRVPQAERERLERLNNNKGEN